jgi:hypothetical protein
VAVERLADHERPLLLLARRQRRPSRRPERDRLRRRHRLLLPGQPLRRADARQCHLARLQDADHGRGDLRPGPSALQRLRGLGDLHVPPRQGLPVPGATRLDSGHLVSPGDSSGDGDGGQRFHARLRRPLLFPDTRGSALGRPLHQPAGATNTYHGIEFSAVKRLSNHWLARASFGWNPLDAGRTTPSDPGSQQQLVVGRPERGRRSRRRLFGQEHALDQRPVAVQPVGALSVSVGNQSRGKLLRTRGLSPVLLHPGGRIRHRRLTQAEPRGQDRPVSGSTTCTSSTCAWRKTFNIGLLALS